MSPILGFGLLALSLLASVTFAKLHIDGGAYASTLLGLGVAVIQANAHAGANAKAAAAASKLSALRSAPPATPPTGTA